MITGDILLCSAFIAYMGPFFLNYRDGALQEWKNQLQDKNI